MDVIDMIELLALAALPFCDVVTDQWPERIGDCVEVNVPIARAGVITVDDPIVEIPSNSGIDWAGWVRLRFGPEPDEGYYMIGVVPACIITDGDEQTIVRAGVGGLQEMFPPDHYFASDGHDDGTSLAFSDMPCLSPDERVGVVYAGYSDAVLAAFLEEPLADGWVDGIHVLDVQYASGVLGKISVDVLDAPLYGEWGEATVKVTCVGYSSASVGSGGYSINTHRTNGIAHAGLSSPVACASAGDVGDSVTVAVPTGYFGEIRFSGYGAVAIYRPMGHPDGVFEAPEVSDGYEGQAFLVRSQAFDDFIYIDLERDWEVFEGVCEDWSCVGDYCDGFGLDLVGWFACAFGWDVNLIDYLGGSVDQLMNSPIVSVLTYIPQLLESYPRSVAVLDGQCGDLAILDGTVLEGASMNTCTLPYKTELRTIAGAFMLVVFAMAAFNILQRFWIQGSPGRLGTPTNHLTDGA